MKSFLVLCSVVVFSFGASAQGYTIQQYLNIKSASGPAFSPDSKKIVYLSNATGTSQIWVTDLATNKQTQLTNYEDNVGFVRWLGDGSGMIFGKAKGGDENTQFFWMKPDGSGVKALTDEPGVRHNFGLVTDDGKMIAYASNKRNRQYFDIYTMDLGSGVETLQYQYDGNNDIQAVNGAGNKFIVSRDGIELSLDNNLYLIDAKTKQEILLTPHTGASQFGNAHFVADGLVFTHNDGREFVGLAQLRKKNAATDDWSEKNREISIIDDTKWDVSDVEMTDYGSKIAYTVNRDGFSELYIRGYEMGGKPLISVIDKKAVQVKLPNEGIVNGIRFSQDESKIAFTFNSASSPSEVWTYDLGKQQLRRVTFSDTAGIPAVTFTQPKLITYKSFDGRMIPAWFYEPERMRTFKLKMNAPQKEALSSTKPEVPVIVSVHGGPEGQERPGFNALYQYYLSRGYAILATNVRGSTGYGKTFTHLDDVKKREDSVKDLAYSVEWLKKYGGADPKRIAVMGGSYGGYMTLAAITLYPDLWAAAVDTVGISDWETFLKNTSGYRRRQREVEYGRLDRDIDFLRSISPIKKIDRIKCPLFVIAGRNDPRVPWTEGQQMVDALRKRGATVEWKVYDDEGHGVSKLKNRIDLYPKVADFLDRNMKK